MDFHTYIALTQVPTSPKFQLDLNEQNHPRGVSWAKTVSKKVFDWVSYINKVILLVKAPKLKTSPGTGVPWRMNDYLWLYWATRNEIFSICTPGVKPKTDWKKSKPSVILKKCRCISRSHHAAGLLTGHAPGKVQLGKVAGYDSSSLDIICPM